MKHTTRSVNAILKVVMAASLAAGLTIATGAAPAAAASKPVKGGNVTIVAADPQSFNPISQSTLATFGTALYQVYDVLMIESNTTGEIEPVLLKSITSSPDAMVWTFRLRPGIKFTDGTPFDSAAIKYAFDYAANPANRSGGSDVAQEVVSWDVSDPLVAKMTLKAPDAVFAHTVNVRLSMIPSPTALQKYGADYGTSPDKIVGAGPYKLTSWTRGNQMVFSRNADYWDAPRPYLDTVTLKVITDPTVAFNTMQTGGADVMVAPNQDIYNQAKAAGLRSEPYNYGVVSFRSFYQFNLQRPPFNDIIARQAMYAALDPKKVAAAVGQPTADAIYDHDNFYYDKAGTFPKYDPKKAQSLINQWSAKNGGKPLEFTILQIPGVISLGGNAEAIQAALASYQNLKVNIQTVQSSQLPSLGTAGNFDLYPNALGGSDPDIPIHGIFLSTGGRNYMKYSNPEMDAAISGGISVSDPAKRKKFYATVQRLIIQDLPVWIMPTKVYVQGDAIFLSKQIQGYDSGAWMGVNTAKIWLAKKS